MMQIFQNIAIGGLFCGFLFVVPYIFGAAKVAFLGSTTRKTEFGLEDKEIYREGVGVCGIIAISALVFSLFFVVGEALRKMLL